MLEAVSPTGQSVGKLSDSCKNDQVGEQVGDFSQCDRLESPPRVELALARTRRRRRRALHNDLAKDIVERGDWAIFSLFIARGIAIR